MELKLLYIGENEFPFFVSEEFKSNINSFSEINIDNILNQISNNVHQLLINEYDSQTIYGVIKGDDPFFFELEYLNDAYITALVNIKEIELEKYLDAINQNIYYKNESR